MADATTRSSPLSRFTSMVPVTVATAPSATFWLVAGTVPATAEQVGPTVGRVT
jgi:hypothetical protein